MGAQGVQGAQDCPSCLLTYLPTYLPTYGPPNGGRNESMDGLYDFLVLNETRIAHDLTSHPPPDKDRIGDAEVLHSCIYVMSCHVKL